MAMDIAGNWTGRNADGEYLELCIRSRDSKIAGACAIGAKDARPTLRPIFGSLNGTRLDLAFAAERAGSLARTLQGTVERDTLTIVLDGEPIELSRTETQSTGAGPNDPSIPWADIQCSQGGTEREIYFENSDEAETYVVKSGPRSRDGMGQTRRVLGPSTISFYGRRGSRHTGRTMLIVRLPSRLSGKSIQETQHLFSRTIAGSVLPKVNSPSQGLSRGRTVPSMPRSPLLP